MVLMENKVTQLLKCMGQQSIAIYNSFTWAAAIPADEENGVLAQEEIPGENKYDLQQLMHILVYTSPEVSRGKLSWQTHI